MNLFTLGAIFITIGIILLLKDTVTHDYRLYKIKKEDEPYAIITVKVEDKQFAVCETYFNPLGLSAVIACLDEYYKEQNKDLIKIIVDSRKGGDKNAEEV